MGIGILWAPLIRRINILCLKLERGEYLKMIFPRIVSITVGSMRRSDYVIVDYMVDTLPIDPLLFPSTLQGFST